MVRSAHILAGLCLSWLAALVVRNDVTRNVLYAKCRFVVCVSGIVYCVGSWRFLVVLGRSRPCVLGIEGLTVKWFVVGGFGGLQICSQKCVAH